MACPTCNHMLEGIGHREFHRFWYCHRCGTLVEESRSAHDGPNGWVVLSVYAPKLVGRCREFEKFLHVEPGEMAGWQRLGIADSIRLPKDRPKES
jgi:hypothetical protein